MTEEKIGVPELKEPKEEASLFDEAQISNDLEASNDVQEEVDDENAEWQPIVAKESPKERKERMGVKEKADGKVLTIKSISFTKPRTKTFDGAPIPPKQTQSGDKEYYLGKLKIMFEENDLVEYYPSFHYFVDNAGKMNNFAKINRKGDNTVSNIFRLVVKALGKPEDEVSDQDVYDYLIGKKVKIKTSTGTHKGKKWFRNDIAEFVE